MEVCSAMRIFLLFQRKLKISLFWEKKKKQELLLLYVGDEKGTENRDRETDKGIL